MNAQEWQETSEWADLPCREFCNHRRRGCVPGRCCSPYERSDPRYWLGRGSQPTAGKFGEAHNLERQAIRDHLRARGRYVDGYGELLVAKIQMRLQRDYHRRKPPIGVRRVTSSPAPVQFNADELRHLVDLFDGANDPLSASIAAKAAVLLERAQS